MCCFLIFLKWNLLTKKDLGGWTDKKPKLHVDLISLEPTRESIQTRYWMDVTIWSSAADLGSLDLLKNMMRSSRRKWNKDEKIHRLL